MFLDWTDKTASHTLPNLDEDDVRFKQVCANCATTSDEYSFVSTDDGVSVTYRPAESSVGGPVPSQIFNWAIQLPLHSSGRCTVTLRLSHIDAHAWDFTYQVGLYQWKGGWAVLQRFGDLDTSNEELRLPSVTFLKDEPLFLGFTRVDFGCAPSDEHSLCLHSLGIEAGGAGTHGLSTMEEASAFSGTVIAKTLQTKEDAREPVAVVPRDTLAACEWWGSVTDRSHIVLHAEISGTCSTAIQSMHVHFCAAGTSSFPVVFPASIEDDEAGEHSVFSLSASPIFAEVHAINQISIYVKPTFTTRAEHECDVRIQVLRFTPNIIAHAPSTPAFALADGTPGASAVLSSDLDTNTGAISRLQQQVERLQETTDNIKKTPGPVGTSGKRGAKGDRGEPMRFTDLSEAQKTELRGLRGPTGPRGESLTYEALTAEQKKELTGPTGPTGKQGDTGEKGDRGARGEAFAFSHFTSEQLELIRGERGRQGERGAALTFDQLTANEQDSLRGEQGPRGEKGDQGERGEVGRIGPTGPRGPEGKTGPRGLPGIPGTRGEAGGRGKAGIDGKDGMCASICGTFASMALLEDFLHKARHIQSNTYYIIDNEESGEHGTLVAYTGLLSVDLLIGCTYVDNLMPLFEKHKAVVRAQVLHTEDNWKVSVDICSDDAGVYPLRRSLEASIQQSGYEVHSSDVTAHAVRPVGKLCGQRGYQGPAGQAGVPGKSMMGLRLDYIGDEVARLKAKPENRSVFLQVSASKTSEAGFYLYDSQANRWSLLHGVSIDDEFTKWMVSFLENPHQDSIPIALSMFSTTQKHMDAQYNTLKGEFADYRTTNDKWKSLQFEHWKTVGNSQYQQVVMQLNEQKQEIESTSLQLSHLSDSSVIKEEMNQLRKLYDGQYQKLEAGFRAIKDKVGSGGAADDRPAFDKAAYDAEFDKTNAKLQEFDLSLVKMLKVMAFLKTSPWNKTTRLIRQDVDKALLEQEAKRATLEKDIVSRLDTQTITTRDLSEEVHVMQTKHGQLHDVVTKSVEELAQHTAKQKKQGQRVEYHIEHDFPEAVARWREELENVQSRDASTQQRLSEVNTRIELQNEQAAYFTDKLTRLAQEQTARTDTLRSEVLGAHTKENYLIRQEMLDADNEVRQTVSQQAQEIKTIQRSIEKQLQDVDLQTASMCKKNASQCSAYAKEVGTELRSRCDGADKRLTAGEKKHGDLAAELTAFMDRYKVQAAAAEEQAGARLETSVAKLTQETDRKVLKAAEMMQAEWQTYEKKVAEQFVDINRFAAEVKSDLHTTDDKWATALDTQLAKGAAESAHQLNRLRTELQKATHGVECKLADCSAEWKDALKQSSDTSHYEHKQLAQRIGDTEAKLATSLDHRLTATTTNTDSKLRELDQRHTNAVQSVNDDVHNIDNKCSTMEYMLKARLTSIEEHVQQLFADGQAMCESTVTKNKDDILKNFEKMRGELMQYQKKTCQNMTDQMARSDEQSAERQAKTVGELQAMQKQQRAMVERNATFEKRLLEKQASDAEAVAKIRKEHQQAADTLRGIIQTRCGELDGRLKATTDGLRNELLRTCDEKVRRVESALEESEKRSERQLQALSSQLNGSISTLTKSVAEVMAAVKSASDRQGEYRRVHDERMRTIVGMTKALHAELATATA